MGSVQLPPPQSFSTQLRLPPTLTRHTCSRRCCLSIPQRQTLSQVKDVDSLLTVFADDWVDIEYDDCDITNGESIRDQLSNARRTWGNCMRT